MTRKVLVESISVVEVEIPDEIFEMPDCDLAEYVRDANNWGGPEGKSGTMIKDFYVGSILLHSQLKAGSPYAKILRWWDSGKCHVLIEDDMRTWHTEDELIRDRLAGDGVARG